MPGTENPGIVLEDLAVHPVRIDTDPPEALAVLPGLTDTDIRRILDYRARRPLRHILDLTNAGIDQSLLISLLPYTAVSQQPSAIQASLRALSRGCLTNNSWSNPSLDVRAGARTGTLQWSAAYRSPWGAYPVLDTNGLPAGLCGGISWQSGGLRAVAGDFQVSLGQGVLLGRRAAVIPWNAWDEPIRKKDCPGRLFTGSTTDRDSDGTPDIFRGILVSGTLDAWEINGLYPAPRLLLFHSPQAVSGGYDSSGVSLSAAFAPAARLEFTYLSSALSNSAALDSCSLSFRFLTGTLELSAEIAQSAGLAGSASAVSGNGPFRWGLSLYLAENSFRAPSGEAGAHDKPGTLGFCGGAWFNPGFAAFNLLADIYRTPTSPVWCGSMDLRSETPAFTLFQGLKALLLLRIRYSDNTDGRVARLYGRAAFRLGDNTGITLYSQNGWRFDKNLSGMLASMRFYFQAVRIFKASFTATAVMGPPNGLEFFTSGDKVSMEDMTLDSYSGNMYDLKALAGIELGACTLGFRAALQLHDNSMDLNWAVFNGWNF